jgi:chorismate mutase/prephenate dehydratase
MNPDEQLSKIRERIDAIDSQLLELISERARCAQAVAQVKLDASQSDEAPPVFYRPEREAQVLRAIQERNPGPLASEHIASVFRELMSSCLALEQPLSVAFLGARGHLFTSRGFEAFWSIGTAARSSQYPQSLSAG